MKTKQDFLKIQPRPLNGGTQRVTFFPNGYGASIIQHSFSYGGRDGLWELAVLRGKLEDWHICYDTPIADDVLGHLTDVEVNETIEKISKLKQ
jgi:hypothetical protein